MFVRFVTLLRARLDFRLWCLYEVTSNPRKDLGIVIEHKSITGLKLQNSVLNTNLSLRRISSAQVEAAKDEVQLSKKQENTYNQYTILSIFYWEAE